MGACARLSWIFEGFFVCLIGECLFMGDSSALRLCDFWAFVRWSSDDDDWSFEIEHGRLALNLMISGLIRYCTIDETKLPFEDLEC